MKLRTRERYSLRMMMAIAKLSSGANPVGLSTISKHCGLSLRYLEQLMPALKHASLVRSISGRGGGYSLAREPSDIKIGDIIQAAIGPIAVTECAAEPQTCIYSDYCSCRYLWALLNHRITRVFEEFSLADLLEENWKSRVMQEIGGSHQQTNNPVNLPNCSKGDGVS